MATVEFRNVSKNFDQVKVIEDFNLSIADAEFVVFVGPSGCGKSTCLRMLAGLETITSGDIYIDGRLVNDIQPKDRSIAMVFQNYALYPHMTVAENIGFGLKMRGYGKDDIKNIVADVARQLELEDYLARRPKELSGGQRQRVAMGRAIARKPAVYLFDEPLSNLDAELRTQIRKEIARIHKRLKTTTIYVTHDQIEALTLADRLVVLNEGKIQQLGTPAEVYNNPQNTFVAGFIGSPKMNFLSVEAKSAGNNYWLEGAGFKLEASPAIVKKLPPYKVLLGVRPEHLKKSLAKESRVSFKGVVELKEPIGSETYINLELAKFSQVIYRQSGTVGVELKQQVELFVQDKDLYFFDNLTGDRLNL